MDVHSTPSQLVQETLNSEGIKQEYHQFLNSMCSEGSRSQTSESAGRTVLRDETLHPYYLAFLRQRASLAGHQVSSDGMLGEGSVSASITPSSSSEALYMRPSCRRMNAADPPAEKIIDEPAHPKSQEFDGTVVDLGGKENEAHEDTEKADVGAPYRIPKWVGKAIEEARLTRVKKHSCLVSLAKEATNAEDYHGAVYSISSGSPPSPYPQMHCKSKARSRFAAPIDLYDGQTDFGADASRRESYVSQGFVVQGNRIKFKNAPLRRILVTGGAGFIGSHLVKKLLGDGYSVIALDNLITGSLSNLEEFDGNPGLAFVNHDILNPLPKRLVVDEVYHLACPSSPFFWQTNLVNTFDIITEGTKNVLDFAQKMGAKMLFASTTEVYGDPELGVEAQSETYKGSVDCFSQRACHDEAKRAAETLCFAYQTERKVKVRIARVGSTYGPKMNKCDGSMVSSFTSALVEGVEVQIPESNEASRTIMYIDDCIDGLVKLMNSNYAGPINIAGDDVISVKDLLDQIKTIVANPSNAIPWKAVEFWPDSGTRRPANAAAFVNLGWYPTVKAREGLKTTVLWYKEEKAKKLDVKEKKAEAIITAHRERERNM